MTSSTAFCSAEWQEPSDLWTCEFLSIHIFLWSFHIFLINLLIQVVPGTLLPLAIRYLVWYSAHSLGITPNPRCFHPRVSISRSICCTLGSRSIMCAAGKSSCHSRRLCPMSLSKSGIHWWERSHCSMSSTPVCQVETILSCWHFDRCCTVSPPV